MSSSGPEPWTPQRRSNQKKKIDKEAGRAAARLGAVSVVMIAFFEDGEFLHMQDGGNAPMPIQELYQRLASAHLIAAEKPGLDVNIQ